MRKEWNPEQKIFLTANGKLWGGGKGGGKITFCFNGKLKYIAHYEYA